MFAKRACWTLLSMLAIPAAATAQDLPWETYEDALSDSVCDVVNAENVELVVSWDSTLGVYNMVVVTGSDIRLADTQVLDNGDVLYLGESAGFIQFDEDGDGYRTLWWVGIGGNVVNVNSFSGEPTVSDYFPGDFHDVPCDACDLWDDTSACDPVDSDDSVVVPPITINFCGTGAALAMAMSMVGLTVMRLAGRRRC